jgi:hypothetical protein
MPPIFTGSMTGVVNEDDPVTIDFSSSRRSENKLARLFTAKFYQPCLFVHKG